MIVFTRITTPLKHTTVFYGDKNKMIWSYKKLIQFVAPMHQRTFLNIHKLRLIICKSLSKFAKGCSNILNVFGKSKDDL